jgi:signal transduction histidine kinase
VELTYGTSALELVVTNPLRAGGGEEREGHGIVGMRERAALVDGTLEARAVGQSFRVTARLPYREAT